MSANIARGALLEDAVRRAVYCASISVTRLGAQKSYPYISELLNPAHFSQDVKPPPPLSEALTEHVFAKSSPGVTEGPMTGASMHSDQTIYDRNKRYIRSALKI